MAYFGFGFVLLGIAAIIRRLDHTERTAPVEAEVPVEVEPPVEAEEPVEVGPPLPGITSDMIKDIFEKR